MTYRLIIFNLLILTTCFSYGKSKKPCTVVTSKKEAPQEALKIKPSTDISPSITTKPETSPTSSQAPKEITTKTEKSKTPPFIVALDEKLCSLFKRFTNKKDTEYTWKEFSSDTAALLKESKDHKEIAKAFEDISTSESITYISYKLFWYKDQLPPKTKDLYDKISKSDLIDATRSRIKLNKKCKTA